VGTNLPTGVIVVDRTVLRRQGGHLLRIYRDKEFFNRLFVIALPIILQYFISSSLNMVGTIMIGQLGDTAIAAVGLANQIFFLFALLMFGINSGSAIFTAQFWGKKDILNIRKVLGLSLALGLVGSAFFVGISVFFPQAIIGIYSKDPAVIAVGSQYLRIFGLSFGFTAITLCYSSVLRSTGDVRTPLLVSIAALSINTLLSYILIFGKFGMPALGVIGAAYAVLIARILESSAH
jgi:Na+-driven multidrug efflux pump